MIYERFFMKPTVSVIIAVYNTRKYLRSCLESVRRQSIENIEIILVDDGSTDGSGELCDKLAAMDERIKVIHQSNAGVSAAKNAGIQHASGDYLFFLDSDDEIDGNDSLSVQLNKAIKTGADITVGSYRRFYDKGDTRYFFPVHRHHLEGVDQGSRRFRFMGFYEYGNLSYLAFKLYKASFLKTNDLTIPAFQMMEDKSHSMRCMAMGARYAFIEDSVYLYRIRPDSATDAYQEDLIDLLINVGKSFIQFLNDKNIQDDYSDIIAMHYVLGSLFLIKQELMEKGHGRRAAIDAVKKYYADSVVKTYVDRLARGMYLDEAGGILKLLISFYSRSMAKGHYGIMIFCTRLYILRDIMFQKMPGKEKQTLDKK